MKIWLDDERPAPDDSWHVVKTSEAALHAIIANRGNIETLSLDHDLGGDDTGYRVISWLEEHVVLYGFPAPPDICVHSANSVGMARMRQTIESIRRHQREQAAASGVEVRAEVPRHRPHYLGQLAFYNLNEACVTLHRAYSAYGYGLYLVGSALRTSDYRDVDVRCILKDENFDRMFPGVAKSQAPHTNALWALTCSAISTWLEQRTGLPIDFQIQRMTDANRDFPHKRNALGHQLEKDEDD